MGQFRVAFPTNHFDAAVAFYRSNFTTETMSEWDGPDRGVVLRIAGDGCVEMFDAGPGTGATPLGLIIAIELASVEAVNQRFEQLKDAAPVTVAIEDAPWGHRTFRVEDPSGITLAFFAALQTP